MTLVQLRRQNTNPETDSETELADRQAGDILKLCGPAMNILRRAMRTNMIRHSAQDAVLTALEALEREIERRET